ncbi:site-2 protease family protein [Allopontixanthobacter sediminis]|uniref:Site-2 protease family protein n=1 Tax=Allopontixanthobacter sediminis TaxID=1689985 RepID=A0A845B038_9SPHN|nr:site-2 protease family protein [Allopontixanthobacter sediminis]MXP43042.1 site-2 protease family protein [Allopontixanthobacter sediminis]
MTDTILIAAILIPALIIAIVFHEVAHGWAALALGDPTAQERGRLTLNPLRHVDPVGTLLVPGFLALVGGPIFGWAKPVPVMQRRLSNPRFGMMAVAAAGPGTNFVLAAVAAVAFGLAAPLGAQISFGETGMSTIVGPAGDVLPLVTGLFYFLLINVFIGMFNLLPIPPFDGSHIVEGAMPRRWVHHYEKLRPFGMLLFFGLIALTWFAPGLGVLENTIGPPVNWMLGKYLGLADTVSGA